MPKAFIASTFWSVSICTYTFAVKYASECPSILETTFILTPFFINADANECLKLMVH